MKLTADVLIESLGPSKSRLLQGVAACASRALAAHGLARRPPWVCTGIERNDLQDVCVFVYRHDKVMLWSCKARDIRDVDQSGLSEGTVLLRATVPPAILRIHGPRVTHVEEFLRFLTKLLQASTAVLRCHGPSDYRPCHCGPLPRGSQ